MFLCMTRRLNVLYKCLIVSNGAQNRNRYNQVPSFVEIPTEVIKLNSAHKIALLMINFCERQMDRQTDRQTGSRENSMSPDPSRGKPNNPIDMFESVNSITTAIPTGVQLKRKTKLPTVIGLTTKHVICCNNLMLKPIFL